MKPYYVLYLSIILTGFIFGWRNYRKSFKPIRFAIVLLGCTFVAEVVNYWTALVYRNNWVSTQIYSLASTAIYTALFYESIINKKLRKVMLFTGVAIILFWFANFIWWEPMSKPTATYFRVKVLFTFVGGCILLIQQLDLPGKIQILKNPTFLIALAIVWFNSVSSLNYFLSAVLFKHDLDNIFLNELHIYSNLVHYSLFLLAMIFLKNYWNNVGRTIE